MTFDDGIIKIYRLVNVSEKGDKPKYKMFYKSSFYFSYETLGLTRYYTALANNEKIETVVNIYQDRSIRVNDIARFEDDSEFKIVLAQHFKDSDGIDCTKLSLERRNNNVCCFDT